MEIQILHWFGSLHNPVLNPIMYGITTLGNAGFLWILMALLCLTVLPKKYRKIGFTIAAALIFSLIFCNGIMKNLWQRPRCFWENGQYMVISNEFENLYNIFNSISDFSFPSGHTSASFAAALAIFMCHCSCFINCNIKTLPYSPLSNRCTCQSHFWKFVWNYCILYC